MRVRFLALAFVSYLVIAIILLWPLPLSLGTSVINAGDPLFYAWNLSHNWQEITHGFTNLLDTNLYYPTTNTLAFSDTLLAQTLMMSPVLALTGNPLMAENLYTLLTFPIAGVGMLLLAYYITRHPYASFLAGLFFAFCIPRLGQISHMPAISSQWFPFLILFLLRYMARGGKQNLAFVLLSFLLLTTSTIYFFVFGFIASAIIIAGYTAVYIYKKEYATARERILYAIPMALVGIMLTAVFNYPYIRLKAENPGIRRSIEEAAVFAAYQEDYYSVTNTSMIYSKLLKTAEGERTLFPTFTLLALVIASFFFVKQWKKESALIAIVGAAAFILSFGPTRAFRLGPLDTGYIPMPYTAAYKIFPLLQIIRVPARFSILVALGMSMLAALTLAKMDEDQKKKILFAIIGLLYLIEIWQAPLALVSVPAYPQVPAVYQWLRDQKNVRILELPMARIETGATPIQDQVKKPYDKLTIADSLVLETYRAYFAGYHLKQTANGYSGFVPSSYNETVELVQNFPNLTAIAFLRRRGLTHVILHTSQFPEAQKSTILDEMKVDGLREVARFNDDIVYEIIR